MRVDVAQQRGLRDGPHDGLHPPARLEQHHRGDAADAVLGGGVWGLVGVELHDLQPSFVLTAAAPRRAEGRGAVWCGVVWSGPSGVTYVTHWSGVTYVTYWSGVTYVTHHTWVK